MQISSELERKAVPSQGGYLEGELGDIYWWMVMGNWGQTPGQVSSASLQAICLQQGTGHPSTEAKEGSLGSFFRMPKSSAQSPPRDFYGLKGNLPVIPSAATRLESPQHNKSFKEQSVFILRQKICVKTLSVLHFLSLFFPPPGARGRTDRHYLKKILQRNVKIDMLT